jgi:alkanesulfonate monooxygenase SsuD/methylene tetrahydromethanopterin reductase-like flavin-dependent oxidoreductase (luciferase family)
MGAELRLDQIPEHARAADDLGFSHITFVDQSNVSRECNAMMTLAAMNSTRAHIGHSVCDPNMYHPAVIGNFIASLRELTGGRAFVGIGAGDPLAGKALARPVGMQQQRETVEFLKKFVAGEEAVLWGQSWHSEWIRHTDWAGKAVDVWMGPVGPKSMQMAGEIADQIWVFGAGEPIIAQWYLEQIQIGAERAGRDFSKIKVWARTQVYLTDNKEDARREVSSYASSCSAGVYRSSFLRNSPEAQDLAKRLEKNRPGLIEKLKLIYENYDPYWHERIDAPHSNLATQDVIDTFNLVGPVDEVAEKATKLQNLGFAGLSMVQFAILDQIGNMRRIAEELMPRFAEAPSRP